jgi:hypothetical protein
MGAPSPNKTALVDEALENIYGQHGVVTPELLLEIASDPSHPLHSEFEWDNAEAANKYRLEQAAQMIRASKFVAYLSADKKDPIPVRRWIVMPGGKGEYVPRQKAMKIVDVREDFVNRKLAALQSWCNETADIEELAALRHSILVGMAKM